MYCSQCGSQNDPAAVFCSQCGASLRSGNIPTVRLGPPATTVSPAVPSAAQTTRYANFGWRFLAVILDWIVLFPGFFVVQGIAIVFGMGMFVLDEDATAPYSHVQPWPDLLVIAMWWLYEALMVSSSHQATLGKKAVGIVVTDMEGSRISFPRATGRYFASILSGMLLLIGFLIQPFTEKRQTLHDMMAGCLVLRKDPH